MPTLSSLSATTSLEDWLHALESLNPLKIVLGLERIGTVATALKLPKRPFAKSIVVAGTNGKGSSAAMLEAIYRAGGYHTALFTSPHLIDFRERARINGEPLPAPALTAAFAAVAHAQEQAGNPFLSYFEFTTLAILHAFCQNTVDIAILEVGMGGRLDAVNLVDADLALITPIDLDHTAFLGPDREAIGAEKAGVIKPQQHLVTTDPAPPASILAAAKRLGLYCHCIGVDFGFDAAPESPQQWRYHGISTNHQRRQISYPVPALRGPQQLQNAAGVLAAIELLGDSLPVTQQAIRWGLGKVQWPGRFQVLPEQPMVVLDVAHNPHACKALATNLKTLPFAPTTVAIFGAMADKDIDAMLPPLLPLIDIWYTCALPTPRAAAPEVLSSVIKRLSPQAVVHCCPDPVAALLSARQNLQQQDRILVFGSFHTVGAILTHHSP